MTPDELDAVAALHRARREQQQAKAGALFALAVDSNGTPIASVTIPVDPPSDAEVRQIARLQRLDVLFQPAAGTAS